MRYSELAEFSQLSDRGLLERKLVAFASVLGFDRVSAAVACDDGSAEPSPFKLLGNTPKAFQEKFVSVEDARRDPVMRRLKVSSVPFAYDQAMYVACGSGDVWETQAEFGYKTGLALALHLPRGRHFLFGVDRDQRLPSDQEELTLTMARVHLLAGFCMDAALRCIGNDNVPASAIELTKRERQVLRWTLAGKSSWVAGTILGVRETTVNFHIRNAMRKLGVSSKHVAAAKAAALKLI